MGQKLKKGTRKGSEILAGLLSVITAASVVPMQAFAVESFPEVSPTVETAIEEKPKRRKFRFCPKTQAGARKA